MSAPLKKRIAYLEALLAAEIAAKEKLFCFYSENPRELVTYKMRNEAALAALQDLDYFDGGKK